jgi:hypothetical protein
MDGVSGVVMRYVERGPMPVRRVVLVVAVVAASWISINAFGGWKQWLVALAGLTIAGCLGELYVHSRKRGWL